MTLQNMIKSINPHTRRNAERLLNSDNMYSLKWFGDVYEAFILRKKDLLLPNVGIDQDTQEIIEYECKCSSNDEICVHLAAMFLGIEKMLAAGCDDYHKIMTVQKRNVSESQNSVAYVN